MNFDFKYMYNYLLSHTFPGLLFGIEIIVYLYLILKFDFLGFLKRVGLGISEHAIVLTILAYAFSTLLGVIIDGIHHFVYEDMEDCELYIKLFKPNKVPVSSQSKFLVIHNKDIMAIFNHFLDDDYYYPYEAYANISVVAVTGIPFFIYWLIQEHSLLSILLKIIFFVLYILILLVIIYEAKVTLVVYEEEEKEFINAFLSNKEEE